MLVMRFNRVGRKNHAQYRIVVQEKTVAPSGRHAAVVGSYDPHLKKTVLKVEKIKTFIANGAQPSDSVYNLLVREGVIKGKKRFVKLPEKKVEEDIAGEANTETEEKNGKEIAEKTEKSKDETPIKEEVKNDDGKEEIKEVVSAMENDSDDKKEGEKK